MNRLTHWSQVHTVDPWKDFPSDDYPDYVHGWNSGEELFGELIAEIRPALTIEVGTWLGASALHMANLNKQHATEGVILCVDTWLGSLEFWTRRDDPERYQALRCEFGYPTVYRQFIANVIHAGMQDVIIPFPNTSEIAAAWVKDAGFKADLIYLDASHNYRAVVNDMRDWWKNLRPGGVLFGDDLAAWPGVRMAFDHFSTVVKCSTSTSGNKWVMRKPLADSAGGE